MKCLVLAGGSSERLWPLSRRDYPKQFMEIREGRSIFQDAVLRNMPFCDEFVVITNKKYENIAKGQLQDFQGLKYTFILEDVPLKTAPGVIAYALKSQPEEELLIVSTDSIIDGDYKQTVSDIGEVVAQDKIAVVVTKPTNKSGGYNFVTMAGKKPVFSSKRGKASYWDCGIFGAKAGVLLLAFDEEFIKRCKNLNLENYEITKEQAKKIKPVSLGKIMKTENCVLVKASFEWSRITDISSFYRYYESNSADDSNAICNNGKGVEIVNMVDDQLIVVNGLKNVIVVNTRDAIYVSNEPLGADIKSIADKHGSDKARYFYAPPKKYEDWGNEELLARSGGCRISRLVIYPGMKVEAAGLPTTIRSYFVSSGRAKLTEEFTDRDVDLNGSFTIGGDKTYQIENNGKDILGLICIEKERNAEDAASNEEPNGLVKLRPVFKDNLWGGTKIRDVLGKNVGKMEIIAESWELSAHPDGECKIATGMYKGKTLNEYISLVGKDKLGWKSQTYDRFPLMIKFIDAKRNLSIQVHPADDYALRVEGEYGKNEMWYIMDAGGDACIYVGFNRDVTEEELRRRIADNTILEVLNKVPVHKGESYFLEAGTVHAIGAGCLICEIQQSSNITYRLYDYGRLDKNGLPRDLHLDKAFDVLDMKKSVPTANPQYEAIINSDFIRRLIGQCKYFNVTNYFIDGECLLPVTESSFKAIVVLSGEAEISDGRKKYTARFGDTWFALSKELITLRGKCSVLLVSI